jgi:hypothetical protein
MGQGTGGKGDPASQLDQMDSEIPVTRTPDGPFDAPPPPRLQSPVDRGGDKADSRTHRLTMRCDAMRCVSCMWVGSGN